MTFEDISSKSPSTESNKRDTFGPGTQVRNSVPLNETDPFRPKGPKKPTFLYDTEPVDLKEFNL